MSKVVKFSYIRLLVIYFYLVFICILVRIIYTFLVRLHLIGAGAFDLDSFLFILVRSEI